MAEKLTKFGLNLTKMCRKTKFACWGRFALRFLGFWLGDLMELDGVLRGFRRMKR